MKLKQLLTLSTVALALGAAGSAHAQVMAEKGKKANLVLVPKFIGILVFDQAHTARARRTKSSATPARSSSSGRPRRTASRGRSRS